MFFKVAASLLFIGAVAAYKLEGENLEKRSVGGPNYICFQHPLDITFVIDASASIWAQNFTKAKKFINSFIDPYVIGPDKVRVALETYADVVYKRDVIYFNDYLKKKDLQEKIAGLEWHHGSATKTGDGIEFMTNDLYPLTRPDVPKIVIIITDGKSQEPEKTLEAAQAARAQGIDLFAIGVSDQVRREELENIAGDPDRVIIVDTYEELEAIKDKLSGKTCKEMPTPPPTQAAEECGRIHPTDIYYVFDPAYLGFERTAWVTQFISHTLDIREFLYMKIGVISGSCPLDAGFNLKQFKNFELIRTRLAYYDQPKLTTLVESLSRAFSRRNGGRNQARKVAVIFIGGKVDASAIIDRAMEARGQEIDVFFADAGNADHHLLDALKEMGFKVFNGSAFLQAQRFAEELCRE